MTTQVLVEKEALEKSVALIERRGKGVVRCDINKQSRGNLAEEQKVRRGGGNGTTVAIISRDGVAIGAKLP